MAGSATRVPGGTGISKPRRPRAAAAQRFTSPREPAAPAIGRGESIAAYARRLIDAEPMQRIELEREGVAASLIKALAQAMDLPATEVYAMLGVPRSTAEKKHAAGSRISGAHGQAAIAMMRLLGIAQRIVANSTADAASGFDTARWLGQWIREPQPSLGGRRPADLLDTPTGAEAVMRVLGALESGAYQ